MATEDELADQLKRLGDELDARGVRHRALEPYAQRVPGRRAIPPAIVQARLTQAYTSLMAMSEMPWGKLIVSSKLDRLEVTGIDTGDKDVDKRIWEEVWQENAMDLESKLAHRSALLDGRAHALVWPDEKGAPEITLDDATQMVVAFREGSRRHRVAAMRRWVDEDELEYATLYRPDGLFKFRKRKKGERHQVKESPWVTREVDSEPWPLANPYKVVPAVEIAVNRQLAAGPFAYARGEFEDEIGLMDRVNLLTFLGLVVALWMGFPLRGVIGEPILHRILTDDNGNPLFGSDGEEKTETVPPFESRPDSVFQFENPQARIEEFKAADRGNLSIFDELAQLAAATSTPRHYFPVGGAIANISAETIRAFEGAMHATVNGSHKPSLGESWEEVNRLGGLMLDKPVEVPASASLAWADHESRSLGERADAFLKLSQGHLPWIASAELALNLTQDQLRRYEADQAGSAIATLIAATREGATAGANGQG